MAVRLDYLVRETTNNLARNLSLTLGTILTVTIALTLVGLALVSSQGVGNLSERYQKEVEFIIWLKDPVSDRSACEGSDEVARAECESAVARYEQTKTLIQKDLDSSEAVERADFINQEQTFIEFQAYYAESPQILELVTVESMPESFKVVPKSTDSGVIEDFRERYADEPGVRSVSAAEDLIEDVQRFSNLSGNLMRIAAIVAMIASSLLMYNSIRTAVFSRRREIEVMSLVGATKWFIRVPFMFEALFQGVVGAFVGVFFVIVTNIALLPRIEDIGPRFVGLQLGTGDLVVISVILLVAGAALGSLASLVAVSKYLDA